MYQVSGSIGISKQRVRHPSFYFFVIFFHIVSLSLCQLSYVFEISRVEPKILQYKSGTLTDHSSSVPSKDHSLLVLHPVETHPTDQRSLDLQKSLNVNIASYFINTLACPHVCSSPKKDNPSKPQRGKSNWNPSEESQEISNPMEDPSWLQKDVIQRCQRENSAPTKFEIQIWV